MAKRKVTPTTEKYNECIREAKNIVALLKLQNKHRIQVAGIAIKACTIKHGGRAPITRLTLTSFANKIGVNPKTLFEWTRKKRAIYDKLERNDKVAFEELPYDAVRMMLKEVDLKTSKAKVRRIFSRISKQAPITTKLHRYTKNLDTIIYNLSAFSRSSEIPEDVLLDWTKRARTIVALSEKTLEIKKDGKKIIKVKPMKIDWDNFFSEEVNVN